MKVTSCAALMLFSPLCFGDILPNLQHDDLSFSSPHSLYLSSQDGATHERSIEGGYSYNLIRSVDLYVGARMNGNDQSQSGVLSGVSYQWSDRWVISSALRAYKYDAITKEKGDANLAAEVTSHFKLNENLAVHATLDYQDWQQEVAVGIGFRF
ncbi:hypothetical protein HGP28_05080 [Vibrio sp. SM6]|uniref:Uncharacterized protein n=1 Tax=Vibrio agarilyticus TaxID=2726741 RepID=A0A7X8TPE0_9VIBR|nr:hypothetical protein [Vibrio agarilyticus]NLS12269.1 hypothetical protein [Vibrio agarilyticus]